VVRISAQARELTRTRLLQSAASAFARDGLVRANINAISLDAGLAKGTVYNYFPSKEALFAAVVEEACRRTAADSDDPGPGTPTRERLRALVRADVAWAAEHEPFARVLVREVFSGEPELYARVVEAAAPYVGRVVEVLRDGVDRGEVGVDRPVEQLALVFTGFGLLALAQHWGSGNTWPALDEIPDLVVDVFVDGVGSPTVEVPRRRLARTQRAQGGRASDGR
jgi:AcrR family transcriptional regulator